MTESTSVEVTEDQAFFQQYKFSIARDEHNFCVWFLCVFDDLQYANYIMKN